MNELTLLINGEEARISVEEETPLLWVLRDILGLTGTKYGCGAGLCGSCTVHVDGRAVQSCMVSVGSVQGKRITTIEGIAKTAFSVLQHAWIDENVAQCGYCQPGQIMTAAALLNQIPVPSAADIEEAMAGTLCRCGTYQRIRRAIERAANEGLASTAGSHPAKGHEIAGTMSTGSLAAAGLGRQLPRLLPLAGAISFTAAAGKSRMNRRGFLQVAATAGAGLLIGVALPGCRRVEDDSATTGVRLTEPAARSSPQSQATPVMPEAGLTPGPTDTAAPTAAPTPTAEPTAFFEPNVFLSIDNNGVVTITVHRVEMGQGARTALPMIVAEELEVDWPAIRVVQAPGDAIYGDQQTSGSSCIYDTYAPLRLAGAQARELLITAAAQNWGVDSGSCYADKGTVIHADSGRSMGYGELVTAAASLPPARGRLKDDSEFKLIGTRIGSYDNPQIVTGETVFGADVLVPEMLFAVVARNPELRGGYEDYDSSAAEQVPGVQAVIPIESGVAVVADNTWSALEGSRLLNINWRAGRFSDLNSDDIRSAYRDELTPGTVESDTLAAMYEVAFLAHATPSPMNCTAALDADGCQVWAPTQAPQLAKSTAARLSGLPSENVTLHVPRLGGGFGRRLQVDYVREAVEISQAMGAPVKLIWSREDDIQHDYYHPLSVHQVTADLLGPGMPQIRSRTFGEWDQITGAWRSVSNFTQAFVRESFIDEMAAVLGRDPLELRLELLPHSFQAVLEAAAGQAGWGNPLPAGRGRGIAAYATWDVTRVAMVAEVSLEGRTVRVHKVVAAIDCGRVINPDLVEAQMEGGIAWGLSALLGSEITIQEGNVQQSNFHDYPILRFHQMPEVETIILPSQLQPMGVGEMGVPPIAPAVLNALYAVSGLRIRNLPIRPDDLAGI